LSIFVCSKLDYRRLTEKEELAVSYIYFFHCEYYWKRKVHKK